MANVSTGPGPADHASLARQVRVLSWLTLAWLAADGAIGMTAGLAANSVALIGWGLDCAIEAAASLVIIWRFTGTRIQSGEAERLTQKVVAVSFFLLVPYITAEAVGQLITGNAAQPSWIGIALAATDAILMPLLGRAKKRTGARLRSHATASAGTQNILCAYLSIAVLLGLASNAVLGWWQADPVMALLVAAVCVDAGTKAWRGQTCDDQIAS